MDAQNYWFSSGAAGGGGGDPGDPIGQSLRFREAELARDGTTESTVYTLSFWVKKAIQNTASTLFSASSRGQTISYNASNQLFYNQSATSGTTTAVYRDPAAWYHVVYNYVSDTDTLSLWVNGESENQNLSNGANSWGGDITIGDSGSTQDYYMAEVYFIDGQALQPTEFGRENDDGVWVPITPDIDQAEIWSNDLTCSGAGFDADRPAVDAFDGVNTNFAASGFANETITWTPTDGFDYTASVQVRTPRADNRARINGGAWTNLTQNGNTTIATGSGTINTIEVEGVGTTAAVAQFFADGARIDDTNGGYGANGFNLDFSDSADLGNDSSGNGNDFTPSGFNTNSSSPDYDWVQDSPTQNYATFNPIIPTTSNLTIQGGNLATFDRGNPGVVVPSTIPLNGQVYYEWLSGSVFSSGVRVGIARANDLTSTCEVDSDGTLTNFGTAETDWETWTASTRIGVAYNSDTNQVTFYRNGADARTVTANVEDDFVFFIENSSNSSGSGDFGQQQFVSLPTGFTALQTDNLPTPTISNGSDNFRALTGTGANILGIAQGTNNNGTNWNTNVNTGFTTGLWWIKSRTNPDGQINQHQISNSVLPANNWGHCPGSANAFEAYQAPDSDSIVWCWSGDEVTGADLTAVNANGDLDLIGLVRNVDAGFSTGYYNGSSTAGSNETPGTQLSFPHGLSQAPEFVVVSLMDNNGTGSTNYWPAYSSLPPRADRSFYLRSGDAGFDPDFFWTTEQEATTNTLVRVRVAPSSLVSNDLNRRRTCGYDSNYFFMAFHSVPGYSAFGSYTGNGANDGTFIYTGFRPAWVMIRPIDSSNDWLIMDSTRSPTNPVNNTLSADTTGGDNTGDNRIDIHSNGFKNIVGLGGNNGNQDYVYFAFAENPFGGENVSPANAR